MTDAPDTAKIESKVDEFIEAVKQRAELSDEEARAIVDLLQNIDDKLTALLGQFGVEIGDERVD